MSYLLDTNICIYLIKKRIPSLIERLTQYPTGDIMISSISVAELEYGIQKSFNPEKNRDVFLEFLIPFRLEPFDPKASEEYGKIRLALEKKGKVIGPLDMLIAAHALSLQATLVTNNMKEFSRVPGLSVENWVKSVL